MLKKLFSNGPINSITAAAGVVAFASLASRLLGIFRDRVLASQFGASEMLDIYYAAFRLPDFIYTFLILGGLSAGFVPLLAGYLKSEDKKIVWQFANSVLSIGLLLVVPIIVLMIFLSPWLISWLIVPGFSATSQETTVLLSRIMFLSPLFLGLSGVMSGILQSFKRFFIYSLAPIFYNIGIIVGALYFFPHWGIMGLAWGVVLGALLHFLIQLPAVGKLGWRFKPRIDFKDPGLKKLFRLMIPRALNLLVIQLNLVIITVIASHMAEGSITVFNLANNLQSFPVGIIGISFAVAAFPTLSQYIAEKENNKFVLSLTRTINEILFFVLPFTIIILALRAQIVRVILGSGVFDWTATKLTFETLGLFAISLFAQSLIPIFSRAWFALKNTTIPLIISVAALVINAFLSFYFTFKINLGVPGLALAFSLASILHLVGLWLALRIHFGYLNDLNILKAVYKITIASMAMVPGIQLAKVIMTRLMPLDTFIGVLTQALTASIVGLLIYFAIQWLLRSEELLVLISSTKRRFKLFKGVDEVGPGREV